jgi:hypothetical protein
MIGLSMVRMISAVGVRLMVRTGSRGYPTDQDRIVRDVSGFSGIEAAVVRSR